MVLAAREAAREGTPPQRCWPSPFHTLTLPGSQAQTHTQAPEGGAGPDTAQVPGAAMLVAAEARTGDGGSRRPLVGAAEGPPAPSGLLRLPLTSPRHVNKIVKSSNNVSEHILHFYIFSKNVALVALEVCLQYNSGNQNNQT